MSADSADSSQPSPTGELSSERDAYGALRLRDYRLFLIGHIVSVLGVQMQTVAVGWQLYEQTRSAWALGFVGLAQFTPMLCFALPAGQVADRYDRRDAAGCCSGFWPGPERRARQCRADLCLPVSERHGARLSRPGAFGPGAATRAARVVQQRRLVECQRL
jgi:hypothetical protein